MSQESERRPDWVSHLPDGLKTRVGKLKPWQKKKLFTLGDNGFNNNLLSCAASLRNSFSFEELRTILTTCGDAYDREVDETEIERALRKAYDKPQPRPSKRWPQYDPELVAKIYNESAVKNPHHLTEKFQTKQTELKAILEGLFPNDPLICFGKDLKNPKTQKLSEHLKGDISKLQFIVPSPMSKLTGSTQEGKKYPRCLDNTGPRKYLVIDFDKGTENEQAACIDHLTKFGPLALVLRSGNKGLHAWFECRSESEENLKRFMSYAVTLGGDQALFTKCQFARTPGAIRDNGNPQTIIFYDPLTTSYFDWKIDDLPKEKKDAQEFELTHISEIEFSTKSQDLVENLLLKNDVSVILAPPGVGKSFFALDLAACITTGYDWRDRETEQGAVIYVCLEGVTGFKRRIQALRNESLISNESPFYLLETQLNLLNDEHGEKLINSIKERMGESSEEVKFIVIDTLSRSIPGANENSFEDMTRMLETVQQIQKEVSTHICLVHHSGKDVSKGARGHSSLNAAIGTEITLSKNAQTKIVTAKITKQKDLDSLGKFQFKLNVIQLGLDDKLREITSCIVEHLEELEEGKPGRPKKYTSEMLLEFLPADSIADWKSKALLVDWSDSTFSRKKKELKIGKDYFEQNGKLVRDPKPGSEKESEKNL